MAPFNPDDLRLSDWFSRATTLLSGVGMLHPWRYTTEYLPAEGATYTLFWARIADRSVVGACFPANYAVQRLINMVDKWRYCGWDGVALIVKHTEAGVLHMDKHDVHAAQHVIHR